MTLFQEHGILSVKNYNDGRKKTLTWVSNDTSVDQQKLFKEATYNLTEIVKRIFVRYIQADKNGKTQTNIDFEDNLDSIKEQRHRKFGRCYTFHPEKDIRNLGVYYIRTYL